LLFGEKFQPKTKGETFVKDIFDQLFAYFGNYLALASYLQYSDRQCRNIRRKIEQGIPLRPPVELWIRTQYEQLQKTWK
jgi:hypothetical protein